MDPISRKILAAGAAATAMAAAPRVFAEQTEQGGAGMSFYEKGPVRIHYEEAGSGFPLLLIAGGGLNSTMAGLPRSPFNPIEEFEGEYRASSPISATPMPASPLARSRSTGRGITVTRDFVRKCQTPVLILPDDVPAHPYAVAMECAMLAPKAEVSMYPWKEPRERIPLAVRQIRSFLRAHRPAA